MTRAGKRKPSLRCIDMLKVVEPGGDDGDDDCAGYGGGCVAETYLPCACLRSTTYSLLDHLALWYG